MGLDIDEWVQRAGTSIADLRSMRDACERELQLRSHVCGICGGDIPTALPLKHPAHAPSCLRYEGTVPLNRS
jgi:hypothetical protein